VDRRRPYVALDIEYLGRDRIEAMFDGHAHAGPYAFLALILEAGKPHNVGRPLTMRFRAFARLARCPEDVARAIFATAIGEGLLTVVAITGDGFTVTFPDAAGWEARTAPLTAAERAHNYRGRQAASRAT